MEALFVLVECVYVWGDFEAELAGHRFVRQVLSLHMLLARRNIMVRGGGR